MAVRTTPTDPTRAFLDILARMQEGNARIVGCGYSRTYDAGREGMFADVQVRVDGEGVTERYQFTVEDAPYDGAFKDMNSDNLLRLMQSIDRAENPWEAERWNITAQNLFAKKYGVPAAEQAAREAGCKIGATKPAPPSIRIKFRNDSVISVPIAPMQSFMARACDTLAKIPDPAGIIIGPIARAELYRHPDLARMVDEQTMFGYPIEIGGRTVSMPTSSRPVFEDASPVDTSPDFDDPEFDPPPTNPLRSAPWRPVAAPPPAPPDPTKPQQRNLIFDD